MKHLSKISSILFITILVVISSYSKSIAQLSSGTDNNTQGNNSGAVTTFSGGAIDQPSSLDPGPIDYGSPDPLDAASNPGGPGGDIDDLGEIPLDSGVAFLIAIGLVVGYIQTRKNNQYFLKKVV